MILKRYLTREILHVFLAVFSLLLIIFMSRMMVLYLSQAASGKISADAVLTLMGLMVLQSLTQLVPLCFFVAIIMALGRMQRDNELTAIAGAGLGASFLQGTVRRLTVVFALVLTALALLSNPWARRRLDEIKTQAEEESDVTDISPGRFKEFSEGNRVMYVGGIASDNRTMQDVFLENRNQKNEAVLAADRANLVTEQKTGNRFVVFAKGVRYEGIPGQADYQITEYERFGVRIERDDNNQGMENSKVLPTAELIGSDNPPDLAELQWRISTPIVVFLLAALATMLVQRSSRRDRYGVVLTAILLYFTYSNLLGVSRGMLAHGDLSPYIGLWWVHLLLLILILILEYKLLWPQRLRSSSP